MPSRSAAVLPSTTAGSREVAASRKRPVRTEPPTVSRRSVSDAWTLMPPVSVSGMASVRRTVASTPVSPLAAVTGPMRRIIAVASGGRVASSPRKLCPAWTCSRLVPRASSSARRSALLDAEIPSTATRAAMPMAMPSAVRALRSRRVRRPTLPVARTSRGRSRLTGSAAAGAVRGGGAGVGATMVLTRPPPPRRQGHRVQRGRSGPSCRSGTTAPVAVARSSDCRRPSRRVTQRGSDAAMPWSWVMRTMVEPERCSAWKVSRMSAPVRLSRLPVGSSASSRSGSWTMARAMATRWRSPPESCPGRCVAR